MLDGTDLTIIAAGETVYHAYQAGLMLREKGIQARVLDMSSIKPVDVEAIRKAAEETGRIITVEEHSRFGGLGAIVVETLSEIRFRYALSASPMRTWFMETPMKSLPITDWIKRASARLPLNS